MKQIALIENCQVYEDSDNAVTYVAKAAIDSDGGDNREGDPSWQAGTSLKHNGKPIDAESVPYVVVPPAIIHGVKGIVLGCEARVTDTRTGKSTFAVVADIGPRKKLGEVSVACAKAIGIPSSPITGGVEIHVILYELWPGKAATLNGINYSLQPAPPRT